MDDRYDDYKRWRRRQDLLAAELGQWPAPETEEPDQEETCEVVLYGDENAPTSCGEGCTVEPDGICPHGHPSWLKRWGVL